MAYALIGLGSNLGDRRQLLDEAIERLAQRAGITVVRHSRWRETAAVGGPPDQPAYLNGAVLVETTWDPASLLSEMQQTEAQLGRHRTERWGPRSLDLDLLLYEELVLQTPELVVPHPRMAWRRFVLEPAAEIAPDAIHPPTGWTIAQLLEHLNTAANYVALTGTIAVGKTLLAQRLARLLPVRLVSERGEPARLATFYQNPASNAWAMELEFLRQRTELLSTTHPEWSTSGQYALSDFWFDQSRAFADIWLPSGQTEPYQSRWELARQTVVRPKLIVVLEAPVEQLRRRIQQRGRPGEQDLAEEILVEIHRAILAQAARPDQGPVLRLVNEDPEPAVDELLAAIQSMG
jgi:2-amino-4-hydroxy-6-hydroxymethyldihydropteridine diphosphokinase